MRATLNNILLNLFFFRVFSKHYTPRKASLYIFSPEKLARLLFTEGGLALS